MACATEKQKQINGKIVEVVYAAANLEFTIDGLIHHVAAHNYPAGKGDTSAKPFTTNTLKEQFNTEKKQPTNAQLVQETLEKFGRNCATRNTSICGAKSASTYGAEVGTVFTLEQFDSSNPYVYIVIGCSDLTLNCIGTKVFLYDTFTVQVVGDNPTVAIKNSEAFIHFSTRPNTRETVDAADKIIWTGAGFCDGCKISGDQKNGETLEETCAREQHEERGDLISNVKIIKNLAVEQIQDEQDDFRYLMNGIVRGRISYFTITVYIDTLPVFTKPIDTVEVPIPGFFRKLTELLALPIDAFAFTFHRTKFLDRLVNALVNAKLIIL